MSMHRFVRALALASILSTPPTLWAQAHIGTTADLKPGVPVRFRDSGRWIKGSVVAVTGDSISLSDKQGTVRNYELTGLSELSYSAGKKPMVARGALFGALGGAACGGVMALAYSALGSSNGLEPTTSAWTIVGVSTMAGAAVGAVVGAVSGQEKWEPVQVPSVTPVVVPTRNGVVVALSLRF